MDSLKQYVVEDSVVAAKFLFAALFIIYLIKMWLYSNAAWLHPELLGTAAYVWGMPDVETLPKLLRKVFDWKAFDPNVNRVRPLNDVVEVFDAILRPHFVRFVGAHPSFSISSLLTLTLAPCFLYGYMHRILKKTWPVIVLCMILIASTGFLSLIVSYIRPAKKLNMILLCLALYLGQRYAEDGKERDFFLLCTTLMAAFFSDELGLANFFICGLLFWQSILKSKQKLLIYCSLPILFLVLTKWGLPFIYRMYSVHGAWDALNDSKKFTVFVFLLNSEFYYTAFIQTARSFLSTFGIYKHVPWTEILAIFTLAILPLLQMVRYRHKKLLVILTDPFILISVLIFLVNIYDTLLDWYPFPYEVSYLGSFNYYYHSNIVVLMIVWLTLLLKNITEIIKPQNVSRFLVIFTLIGGVIISANFVLFQKINNLVQIIHLYPFSEKELKGRLTEIRDNYTPNKPLYINFETSRDSIKQEFENTLKYVFNERWKDNGFYQTFNLITKNPIMGNAYLYHLTRAYYPCYKIVVKVDKEQI